MFKTEDIVGDVIFISLNDSERYSAVGIKTEGSHILVKGYDHIGIWVEHPGLAEKTAQVDSKGKPLPDKKIKTTKLEANFLITWDNVKTLMHYPGREGYDFPSEFERHIGFTPSSDTE